MSITLKPEALKNTNEAEIFKLKKFVSFFKSEKVEKIHKILKDFKGEI